MSRRKGESHADYRERENARQRERYWTGGGREYHAAYYQMHKADLAAYYKTRPRPSRPSRARRVATTLTCKGCGVVFTPRHGRSGARGGPAAIYCSRACSNIHARRRGPTKAVQMRRLGILLRRELRRRKGRKPYDPTYYRRYYDERLISLGEVTRIASLPPELHAVARLIQQTRRELNTRRVRNA